MVLLWYQKKKAKKVSISFILQVSLKFLGAIAQLARASRWQREGPGFESP